MSFYVSRYLKEEMASKNCIRIVGAKQNNLKRRRKGRIVVT